MQNFYNYMHIQSVHYTLTENMYIYISCVAKSLCSPSIAVLCALMKWQLCVRVTDLIRIGVPDCGLVSSRMFCVCYLLRMLNRRNMR
jgi:hypothetical protein